MKKTLFISFSVIAVLITMGVCTSRDFPSRVCAQGIPPAMSTDPRQAGCRACHERFYSQWSSSPHGLAMQTFSIEYARMNLTPQANAIPAGGSRYQVDIGGRGIMREKGTWPWEGKEYVITHVLGGRKVCYFFTPAEKGRLKSLPLAYDVLKKAWIDTASAGIRHAQAGHGPWRDSALTFDSTCYGCHVSPVSTNFDLKTDTYLTRLSEPGLLCEACHGPGEAHAGAMKGSPGGTVPGDLKIIGAGRFTSDQHNASCAPCHARMTPITNSYMPGEPFFDHYDLVTLEDRDYFPDGRDLGGNHTYTSWLMNPCARSGGLNCLQCHTPGGGYRYKDRGQANNACMPCHEKNVGNPGSHTHHAPLSEGSMCISCHMPGAGFGTLQHADHSFLPPAPAVSMVYKSPNACMICHKDKDDAWADQWVRRWHKDDYQAPVLKRAGLVDAARRKDWSQLGGMFAYLQSADREEVSAASIIRLLQACPDPGKVPVMRAALKDRSPLVRSSAAEAMGGILLPEVIGDLVAATADPVRIVRIKAASALGQHGMMAMPDNGARKVGKATGEYLASMMVRQDQWTSHYAMGNYFLEHGDARNALVAYKAASKLEPGAAPPHVSASIAHARLLDMKKAEDELDTAMRIDPKSAPALYNMGLLKNEQGKPGEATAYLQQALKNDPTMAPAAFNLAVILSNSRMKDAIVWARKAYELQPDAKYGYTFAYFLKQDGDWNEGIDVLRRVIGKNPFYTDAYLLLGELLEKKGKVKDAEGVYRQGLSVKGMPDFDKIRIEKRLKNLQ